MSRRVGTRGGSDPDRCERVSSQAGTPKLVPYYSGMNNEADSSGLR